MFSKFLKLEPEKQVRIINAAIKEFAHKGYKNASTNEIVKEAGISKGLLFHYFKNKKALFLFLYDYSIEALSKEFFDLSKTFLPEKEYFKKMRQMFLFEYELFKKHPEMYDFFKSTVELEPGDLKDEVESRYQKLLMKDFRDTLEDFDKSKFKEGIDIKKAINTINWSVYGLLNSLGYQPSMIFSLDQVKFNELLAEIDDYIEFLKKCFYK